MDRAPSGVCPVVGFGISDDEPAVSSSVALNKGCNVRSADCRNAVRATLHVPC